MATIPVSIGTQAMVELESLAQLIPSLGRRGVPIEEMMKVLQNITSCMCRSPIAGTYVGIISRSDIIKVVLEPEFMAF